MDTASVLGTSYQPRMLDGYLSDLLETAGAVVIEGPRACGKTMTALNQCNSYIFLDEESNHQLAQLAPDMVLDGASPRLLDEWQLAPSLWNQVRRRVDRHRVPGQFVLTGSSVPSDDVTRHTGAGRFLRVRQRTLSWWERGISTGIVSLADLFAGGKPSADHQAINYEQLVEYLVQPGFPAMQGLSLVNSARLLRGYLREVERVDVSRLIPTRHQPAVVNHLLRSLARCVASEASIATITSDTATVAGELNPATVASYIEVLERLFVVERQTAWSPALRTRARLRTSAKWHLADPSLVAVALGANEQQLRTDPKTVGLLLESAVVHDLTVLTTALEAEVHHYRDSNGYELDAVVALPDGRWAAVEVKIGQSQIPAGVASLNRAVEQIKSEPVFRLVVTGTGGTYVLNDGTITCPLSALKP